jgi:hypothetical protein
VLVIPQPFNINNLIDVYNGLQLIKNLEQYVKPTFVWILKESLNIGIYIKLVISILKEFI